MNTVKKHNLSALAGRAPLVCVLLGAFVANGCGDDQAPRTLAAPPVLLPVDEIVMMKPGATGVIAFRLTTPDGTPAAGERIDFLAVDDPLTTGSQLAGATLSASSGLTDGDGIGMVTVTGGLRTVFRLTARHARAGDATVIVMVGEGDEGTIAVVSTPVVASRAASTVSMVDVLLFDNLSCADLSAVHPPEPLRQRRTVAPGAPTEFAINSMVGSAVIGQGRDTAGKLRGVGCVDVPAGTVVAANTARIYLPLVDFDPVLRGTFLLTSHFSLAKRELTRRAAAPWQDLGDCPLDPGQLWLDCAIDGLGSPAGDSLDCVPASAGAGEGELANLIVARRGNATGGSACRAATLTGGGQGLDAKVAALFPSPAQAPASGIDMLGTSIAAMFDDVAIGSTLSFDATATPRLFHATHTLRTASFNVAGTAGTVDIVTEGAPDSQVRFVPVTTTGDLLAIATHGLGLHLGTLAHTAFAKVALVGHGLPGKTSAYLDVLFQLASTGTGAARKTGCDALDGLVCPEVGRAAGCLRAACVAGQAALAMRLDAGFTLGDGEAADLQLSGSSDMTDDNEDGFADRLGIPSQNVGLWTAQIRARAGTEILSGSWSGLPQTP